MLMPQVAVGRRRWAPGEIPEARLQRGLNRVGVVLAGVLLAVGVVGEVLRADEGHFFLNLFAALAFGAWLIPNAVGWIVRGFLGRT